MGKSSWRTYLMLVIIGYLGCKCVECVFVETAHGWIQGKVTDSAIVFLGVPFAQPPGRWEDPREPSRWDNMWDARYVRPMCLQPPCGANQMLGLCIREMSEDCLYLNVYMPLNTAPSSGKAVMVFLHGGAFESFTAGADIYNAELFAKRGDVIVVTVNYRLGALGFLVTGTGPGSATGNYGIKDQRLALEWVNKNIQKFGGNPENVTLFGQSAGALSALIHLTSRKADKLFQRAIIQSGPFSIPPKSFQDAYSQGVEFSRNLNCSPQNIRCLRRRLPMEVVRAQRATGATGNVLQRFLPWSPHYDGDEVPVNPHTAIEKGLLANKSLIIGTTAHEGLTYVYNIFTSPMNMMTYSGLLLMINQNEAFTWLSRYSPKNSRDAREALSELATDYIFTCPTRQIAEDLSLSQHKVWLYVFDHGMKFLNGTGIMENCHDNACHGGDIPYLFQNLQKVFPLNQEEIRLENDILIYWTNFAKHGNPNGASTNNSSVVWPSYDQTSELPRAVMYFKVPTSNVTLDYKGPICDKFNKMDFRG
ncbi:crystal protein-like [Saccostrea cucullata]|uniref:crystal protein-like n=1 Tax=Saccostrea cuccullata TaxID=36930 RepID=UPI002ECFC94A